MLLNCGSKLWFESPLDWQEIQPINPKRNQSWIVIGKTDSEAETPGHLMQTTASLEKIWCWERLKARGEGDDRGGDGWMASPTQWTWVWVNSGSGCWTGRSGVLRSMGSQRVGHDWAIELKWPEHFSIQNAVHTWAFWLTLGFQC